MAVSRIDEAGLNINQYGNRNLVINGAMQVAQRGTSSTGLGATTGYYTADRWEHQFNGTSGRLTSSVVGITDLAGLRSALKFACTTADTSIATTEYFVLAHKIEGFNIQSVGFGTASAKPLTLSFYAKGNGNAQYTAQLQTGGSNEVSASFNVTSSWQRFEINFPAATSVGSVLDNNNTAQLFVHFWLHAGATYSGGTSLNTTWGSPNNNTMAVGTDNFFSSTSNEFFITGVQLEVGDTATDFEHRTFGDELLRCQRYFVRLGGVGRDYFVGGSNASFGYFSTDLPVQMRSTPSLSNNGGFTINNFAAAGTPTDVDVELASKNRFGFRTSGGVTYTLGNALVFYEASTDSGNLKLDAEL
mgnify:CR=1 FL=1